MHWTEMLLRSFATFTPQIPLYLGLLGLSVFTASAFLADFLSLKSFSARKILNGGPTLVIHNGKILEAGMSKVRLTMDNLMMLLRKKDVFYVDQVEQAYLETDGTLSVLKKPENLPATKKDLNIAAPSRGLPQTVIMDGHIVPRNLAMLGKDELWVKTELQKQGISDFAEVAFAQVDQQERLYADRRGDRLH